MLLVPQLGARWGRVEGGRQGLAGGNPNLAVGEACVDWCRG